MLIVVAPLEQELAGLRHALRRSPPTSGDVATPPAELHVVGVGRNAGQRVRSLLSAHSGQVEAMLLLGFAGALDPSLVTGDVVLAQRYYQDSSHDFVDANLALWCRATAAGCEARLLVKELDSLTVDYLVDSPQQKQALWQRYSVGTVNMEDYWVATAARNAGMPFLAVRAVLDVSTQSLPSYLVGLSGSRSVAALRLASRPWRFPTVLALARQAALASAALTRFALAFSRQSSLASVGR